jgi:hypothetical protein
MQATVVGGTPSLAFAEVQRTSARPRLDLVARSQVSFIFMEGTTMIHRTTPVPVVGLLAVVALLSACGEGSKYAGDWKRELYGEGDVQMKLASNGGVELMLPSPRWPDSVDIKGEANFTGDTLVFKADSTVIPCQTADARYVVNRTENELHIAGVGMDPCGGRRAALVGTWTKS